MTLHDLLPTVCRPTLVGEQVRAARYKEWFTSAMVMIDSVPHAIAWADAGDGFKVAYANPSARKTITAQVGIMPEDGPTLDRVFPELVGRLADPVALPMRLRPIVGRRTYDLRVLAIQSETGAFTGVMAVWSDVTAGEDLAHSFDLQIGGATLSLGKMATVLQRTAQVMRGNASDATALCASVAAASSEASGNVTKVAAAAEQLAESVRRISAQMGQSLDATRAATETAHRTEQIVRTLDDRAREIGKILAIITALAQQTNMLSLNAAIEAARAGEAGKGFGVVASEVKSLAMQTAAATSEIGQHTASIQEATAAAVAALADISLRIGEIASMADSIAHFVSVQAAVTDEIAYRTQQVSQGTAAASKTVGLLSSSAHQVGLVADEALAASTELETSASALNGSVGSFLGKMKKG